MTSIQRMIAPAAMLVLTASLSHAESPKTPSQYENLDASKRYHYSMVKTLNGEVIEDSKMVVQYLRPDRVENLHVFLFEYIVNGNEYSMGYFQMITDRASYTYGLLDPDTFEIDVEDEWFIDLRSPIEAGTQWSFNILYPGEPKVIDEPQLRYSFELAISQMRDSIALGDFTFQDCFDVVQQGTSELQFELLCGGQRIEGTRVRMNVTRTYCLGHGPVSERAEQYLEKDGIQLKGCDFFSYESDLVKIEEIP